MSLRWDNYFYDICETVASNSKCLSRKVGAILVREKSIISTGYNGPPRGVSHCGQRYFLDSYLRKALQVKKIDPDDKTFFSTCPRYILGFKSGEGLEFCIAQHGERGCLINAAREGVCTKGSTLYANCAIPCSPCLTEIINAGVKEIIVTEMVYYDISSEYLIQNSNLKVRLFEHLQNKRTKQK